MQNGMESMLASRRAQLDWFLQSMVAEGLVNNVFLELQNLKQTYGRDFVVRTVISYWRATKNLFTKMSQQLDTNVVDFSDDVLACARDLFERSKSIGVVHVSTACNDIFISCHARDKDCCINGLNTAKREFARVQVKFESVVELERNIIECEDMLANAAAQGHLEMQLERNVIQSEDMQARAAAEIETNPSGPTQLNLFGL